MSFLYQKTQTQITSSLGGSRWFLVGMLAIGFLFVGNVASAQTILGTYTFDADNDIDEAAGHLCPLIAKLV